MMRREWFTLGIHLGYRYEGSPICWPDGSQAPPDEARTYVPTARPGHRAPHAWLADGRSTLDLFGRGFTLLGFGATAGDAAPLVDAARQRRVPLDFVAIAEPQIAALYERKFVLVRPDGHVAWRDDRMPEEPLRLIDVVRGAANGPGVAAWRERANSCKTRVIPLFCRGAIMTKVPSREELAQSGSLEELYGKLSLVGIAPGWNKKVASLWPEPKKNFVPAHWKYEQSRGALDAAGRLINTELAERRNLILYNPASDASYGTVRTMVAAYQMIMPGEWARSHRHTPNALRLILDSEPGTYTEVDGVKIAMEPGDVLLTPNWSSHGHGNDSRACAYWLDFLDVPLVQLLEPMFFEPAEEENGNERIRQRAADQGLAVRVHVKRHAQAARRRQARAVGPVRHACAARQSGDGHDRPSHDAAFAARAHDALPRHHQQHLRHRQRHRRDDGRRRALRMEPRRRDRRSRLAAAFPRSRRGCAACSASATSR